MFSQIFARNMRYLPIALGFSFNSDYFKRNLCTQNSFQALTHPSTKDRIRGEYENKIRMFSTPEKIFEIFATVKKDGVLYMSYVDLFKAICPFNYSDRPEKEILPDLNGSIINFMDLNKDGYISIYEYAILVSFLQISRHDIINYFEKILPDKKITKEGLKSFLNYLREEAKIKLTMTGALPDPRKVHLSNAHFDECLNTIVESLFKKYNEITIDLMVSLKNKFLHEIYDYEFKCFPSMTENKINEEDFAKSIICFLEIPSVAARLKHLEKFNFSEEKQITLQNYADFHLFFKENFHKLEKEVKNRGVITRKRLKKMIEEFCKKTHSNITDRQLDIFIYILDIDNDNRININEFLGVVKNRSFYGSAESHTLNQPFVSVKQYLNKSIDKFHRIIEILKE